MSIRIETHVGREETMKWGPPLSTVVPDIGELPTYDGLKHRTFETRDEATRRPPYAVFESKTVRFAPSSGEHGAEFADPEALLRGESKYGAVLARRRRGRRIDDAYRGPVNLAVFASEIPRFAGPIVVTPASTFARDNARARAPTKRDVPVPPPPGLWAVWKSNLQPDFNPRPPRQAAGLGPHPRARVVKNRYRMHAEFMPECPRFPDDLELLKKMLRKRAARFGRLEAARRAPRPDDETRGRGGVESRDDEPEMDALEALEARVRARSTAQPTPPRTPEPRTATFAGDSLGAAPAPAAEAPSPSRGPNSRASSRPHTPAEAVPRDIRAY
ncbi:hypothetical protein JL720_15626 [Aureococcus anophagefferens]|nr:hypothetical protein JL720_15626 [Aureococcus anophagefferens]